MGRPKGLPKSGGRTKDTPNKSTLEAQKLAEKLGVNPLEVLLLFAGGKWKELGYKSQTTTKFYGENMVVEETIPPELRQKSAKDACEYIYSKRKSIDVLSGGETLASPMIFVNGG